MDMRQFFADPTLRPILEERARALASHDTAVDTDPGEEILTFRLGQDTYGLPITCVRETCLLGSYTRLPSVPPCIVGLVNVRGRLLTLLDIRPLLDITPTPPAATAFLLIVAAHGMEVGLLADTVIEICHTGHELAPTPSTTAGRGNAWIRGVDSSLHIIIDPFLLLKDPRLIVNDTNQ